MDNPLTTAILAIVTVLGVAGGVALCRKFCCKPSVNYTMVNAGLDEEELAFKKAMETQGDDIDELFNFAGEEDLEFDTDDLDNIEMMQASKAKAGSRPNINAVETGSCKEDANRIARNRNGLGSNTRNTSDHHHDSETEDLEALLEGGYMEDMEQSTTIARREGTRDGASESTPNGA